MGSGFICVEMTLAHIIQMKILGSYPMDIPERKKK